MATMLSNEEKINMINQHIRSLEFSKYNADLDLIEANAVSASAEILSEINDRKSIISAKIAALETEKASLTE